MAAIMILLPRIAGGEASSEIAGGEKGKEDAIFVGMVQVWEKLGLGFLFLFSQKKYPDLEIRASFTETGFEKFRVSMEDRSPKILET